MRVTYVLTTADAGAGTERAIFAQANSFARDGDDVSILSVYREVGTPYFDLDPRCRVDYVVDAAPEPEEDGLTLSQRLRRRWEPSRLIPEEWDDQFCSASDAALPSALAAVDCDVLVTSTPALTVLAARFAPPEVVIVEQEHRAAVSRSAASMEPLRRAAPEIDCLVSLTDRSTEWLRAELGPMAPQLETIYNSIPDVFYPQSSLTSTRILAAGRFVPQKNFAHLIQAFAEAAADQPEWTLRIHGHGPHETALRKLIRTVGMESRIELVPPVPDLLAEWSKASVFALSSRSEGLPLVALEAMAAGLPLVAYDCDTGPAEIIEDGLNGLLVPAGDIGGLRSALSQVMSDAALRERLAAHAPEVAERFASDRIHARWKTLFAELVERRERVPNRLARAARYAAEHAADDSGPERLGHDADPELQQSGQPEARMRVETSELKPEPLSRRILAIVDTVLRETGIDHFWVPSYDPVHHVLAVPAEEKPATLAALAEHVPPAVSVILFQGNARLTVDHWNPGGVEPPPAQMAQADVLRVVLSVADTAGAREAITYCDIEFWSEDEDRRLVPPRHNRVLDLVDRTQLEQHSSAAVGDHRIAAPAVVTRRLWSAVDFPIDAVFTWVDDTDEEWQQERAHESARLHRAVHAEATSAGRYRNRDELKYAVRGIEANAPWIRNIYVVTAGQRPTWYRPGSDRLTFVDHSEIFTDGAALPTFNSHAIEANLHHIEGLSEHYLYFNDDTLLARYQRPETYFLGNGLMKFFPSPTKINDLPGLIPPHLAAGMRNRGLLERDFGMTITQGMLHTPYPQRRSVNAEIEQRYAEEWAATVSAKFRSSTDLSIASSLSMYYAYATGRAVPGSIRYTYLPLGADDLGQQMLRARRGAFDVITLGEPAEAPENAEAIDFAVANFLEEILPIPTEFEIGP